MWLVFRNRAKSRAKAAFWHHDAAFGPVLLLRLALAGLRDVNLDVQISWQAQCFVDLEVQSSWQAPRFVDLDAQTSWQAQYFVDLEVYRFRGI